jgi:hypothetical protein
MQDHDQDQDLELWECPPLSAWVSRERCAANRRWACEPTNTKARGAIDDPNFYALRLRECASCKGVEWWAKQTGKPTRSLSAAALVSEHVRADELRRSMGSGYYGRDAIG